MFKYQDEGPHIKWPWCHEDIGNVKRLAPSFRTDLEQTLYLFLDFLGSHADDLAPRFRFSGVSPHSGTAAYKHYRGGVCDCRL